MNLCRLFNLCRFTYVFRSVGPKWFGREPIVLDCIGPIHFRQVQIIMDRSKLWKFAQKSLVLTFIKMICTQPKQFGLDQNNFYPFKTIRKVQNHFGPIEGQGIREHFFKRRTILQTICRHILAHLTNTASISFRITCKEWKTKKRKIPRKMMEK